MHECKTFTALLPHLPTIPNDIVYSVTFCDKDYDQYHTQALQSINWFNSCQVTHNFNI